MTTIEQVRAEQSFRDVDEIREANRHAGHHFFSPDTMRAFRSRLPDQRVYGGRFFVTSEQFAYGDRIEARTYSVHFARPDGTLRLSPDVVKHRASLAEARTLARAAGDGWLEGLEKDGDTSNRYGASDDARAAYEWGRSLRRFEDANAPDEYGNTRADYLREDVKRHQQQIARIEAEIAELEGGAS